MKQKKSLLLRLVRNTWLFFVSIFVSLVLTSPVQCHAVDDDVIRFAGLTWAAVTDHDTVWVIDDDKTDDNNDKALHLRIQDDDDGWHNADIVTKYDMRYGTYRFYVTKTDPYLDDLDPSIIAGFFLTKANCGEDCAYELDIEIGRWRDPSYPNAQFVVQQSGSEEIMHRFELNLDQSQSVHTIHWYPDTVIYSISAGDDPDNILESWSYQGDEVPTEQDHMRLDFDFWLDDGDAPTDDTEDEIIIKDIDVPGVCRTPVDTITCGETVSASTNASTTGSHDQIDSYDNGDWDEWPESGREYAYKFRTNAGDGVSQTVTATLSGLSTDLDVFVIPQEDDAQDCFSANTIAGGNQTVSFTSDDGDKSYYLVVDGIYSNSGSFTLTTDCSGATPPTDPSRTINRLYLPTIQR